MNLTDNKYCAKCKLYINCQNPCMLGEGNKNTGLLVIGDAPTSFEDKHGRVFVGKYSELFHRRMESVGLDGYYTNAVKCTGKKETTPTIRNCCKPFTLKIINDVKPKVIVALGIVPVMQLLNMSYSIKVLRGKKFFHPELNATIIATHSPKQLVYENDALLYAQLREDLQLAKDTLYSIPTRKIPSSIKSLTDPHEVKEYLKYLLTVESAVIDVETTGLDFKNDTITDISFSTKLGEGVHIKWDLIIENKEYADEFFESDVEKVFHNVSFDRKMLWASGFKTINNVKFDTMLAYHTTNMSYEGRESDGLYKLKTMAWFMTQDGGYETILSEDGGIVGIQKKLTKAATDAPKKRKKKVTLTRLSPEIKMLSNSIDTELDGYITSIENKKNNRLLSFNIEKLPYYSAMDSNVTFRIRNHLKKEIDKDYSYPFYNIIMPLSYVLNKMEYNGIKIDVPYVKKLKEENDKTLERLKKEFCKEVGKPDLNLDSPKQLEELLYKDFKVKPNDRFKTKTGYSTNEAALNYYKTKHPILSTLLEYRGLQKQTKTYVDGFLERVDPITDRIHASFMQHGTATGRLSCNNPNLQNIPRNNKIRQMFIPDVGCKIISADLSQAELRVLAQVSGDEEMLRAFYSGKDIHALTACNAILKIPIEQFDKSNPKHKEARDISKVINFGIVYGVSAYSLSIQLNYPMETDEERKSSMDKAQKYIDSWFRLYSGAKAWLDGIQEYAKRYGYVETVFGRRRYLPNVFSSDRKVQEAALRQSCNTPIQGTASDITCIGLIRMQKFLDENEQYRTKIVSVIHDDILLESPESEIEVMSKKLVESMTVDVPRITVPLVADPSVLDRWVKE